MYGTSFKSRERVKRVSSVNKQPIMPYHLLSYFGNIPQNC